MALFKWISTLFGSKEKTEPDDVLVASASPPAVEDDQLDDSFFEESCVKRDRFWENVGTVESDVLSHLISPTFTGGPHWPTTRQAYRIIRREGSIIIATDGLSDPFQDVCGGGNGFESELFIETPDIDPDHAGEPGDITGISKSWAFELIQNVAGTIAGAGGINDRLDRFTVLSIEIPGVSQSHSVATQMPKRFITQDDCIGIMIGAPKPDFPSEIADMPLSPVRIVPVTIMTAAELEHVRTSGPEARITLAAKLLEHGAGHIASFTRPDVL